jgi:hypothetical protein
MLFLIMEVVVLLLRFDFLIFGYYITLAENKTRKPYLRLKHVDLSITSILGGIQPMI